MTGLPFFLKNCSVLMFLYFCGFLTSIEISRFHLTCLESIICQGSLTVTSLMSSVSLLYVTALNVSRFFSRNLSWNPSVILYGYRLFYVGCLTNFDMFFSYFHRLPLKFLMRRPTCVSASMILSLSFLFATCGWFRRNEEIVGP